MPAPPPTPPTHRPASGDPDVGRRAGRRRLRIGLLVGIPALLLALLFVAAWPLVRFFWLKPTISRNYLAELNAATAAIPEADRGWPLYLEAIAQSRPYPDDEFQGVIFDHDNPMHPEHPRWEEARAYILELAPALELVRRAAAKPSSAVPLSSVMTPELDSALRARRPDFPYEPLQPAPANPALLDVLLPHLGEFRRFTRHLALDATVAAHQGDADRAAADIAAICGMARHARETGIFIADRVGVAITSMAANTTLRILTDHPSLFDAVQLESLEGAFAALDDEVFRLRARGERLYFEDALQRTYSDDGRGGGELTAEGGRWVASAQSDGANTRIDSLPVLVLLATVYSDVGRRQIHEAYTDLMDAAELEAGKPHWEADPDSLDGQAEDLLRSNHSLILGILVPTLGHTAAAHVRVRHDRDAALAALAVHRHRRGTGRFPSTLEDLVPAYLPAVPLDMFTGQLLRYVPSAADGPPLLYSVGSDKDDDGGRRPVAVTDKQGKKTAFFQTAVYDGDWVLLGPAAGDGAEGESGGEGEK